MSSNHGSSPVHRVAAAQVRPPRPPSTPKEKGDGLAMAERGAHASSPFVQDLLERPASSQGPTPFLGGGAATRCTA